MNRYLVSAAVLISLALASPSLASAGNGNFEDTPDPAITSGKALKDLNAAREKWASNDIKAYNFKIQASCFCAFIDPVSVKVRGKRKTVSNKDWFGPRSVPQLFKVVKEAINRDAAMLVVKYDKGDGHVRSVSIDYSRHIADEEIAYSVKNFSPK